MQMMQRPKQLLRSWAKGRLKQLVKNLKGKHCVFALQQEGGWGVHLLCLGCAKALRVGADQASTFTALLIDVSKLTFGQRNVHLQPRADSAQHHSSSSRVSARLGKITHSKRSAHLSTNGVDDSIGSPALRDLRHTLGQVLLCDDHHLVRPAGLLAWW